MLQGAELLLPQIPGTVVWTLGLELRSRDVLRREGVGSENVLGPSLKCRGHPCL